MIFWDLSFLLLIITRFFRKMTKPGFPRGVKETVSATYTVLHWIKGSTVIAQQTGTGDFFLHFWPPGSVL